MAKKSDPKAGAVDADKTGLLSALVAEENEFDRHALWRIGSWGAVAVAAVVAAVTANQWSLGLRREQVAAADLSRQAQQIQALTKESQNEMRRLAAAIDTLNGDRDRLFSRVTVLEQGLDSVTGAIAKQNAAAQKPSPVASAMPTMMTPPPTVPADPPPAAAPAAAPGQIAAPPAASATVAAAAIPDKPRPEAAKPDPAPAAAAASSLPQIAAIKPAVPLPAAPAPALGAVKSMMGPPDPAAPKLVEVPKGDIKTADAKSKNVKTAELKSADIKAADAKMGNAAPAAAAAPTAVPAPETAAADAKDKSKAKDQDKAVVDADDAKATVQRTEFAVELGGANSISGLRALWRGLLKSNNAELAELRPIIVLREGHTGLGMQLRLAAGPLQDAAEAAKICASLVETQRTCETTVFDGQRLAMTADEQPATTGTKPSQGARQQSYRRYAPKHAKKEDPPPPPPKETSTFSSLFGRK